MKNIVHPVITIALGIILLSLWGFYSAIRPFKFRSVVTPKTFGVPYEDISFITSDKVKIRGWFIKNPDSKAKTLILLHGYPADKGDILPLTIFLTKKYNLLYFDFRHLGESEGSYTTIGKDETKDLLAAIQYLHTRNIHEVGVWGFSLGGAVALMTAPLAPEIKVIVAESAYARLDWMASDYYRIPVLKYALGELTRFWAWLFLGYDVKKISPAHSAAQLHIPILIIHSKQDNVIAFRNALLLQKALSHNPLAEFIFTDSGRHGEHHLDHDKLIEDFYAKHF